MCGCGLISREVTLGNGTRARCVGSACGFGPNRRDGATKAERIVLSKKSSNFLRIFARRGIRREWESSNPFSHCLPILSVGLQRFRIQPLGAKSDLPLFAAVHRQFRLFPFRWHSKWNSTRTSSEFTLQYPSSENLWRTSRSVPAFLLRGHVSNLSD